MRNLDLTGSKCFGFNEQLELIRVNYTPPLIGAYEIYCYLEALVVRNPGQIRYTFTPEGLEYLYKANSYKTFLISTSLSV